MELTRRSIMRQGEGLRVWFGTHSRKTHLEGIKKKLEKEN